MGDGTYAFTRRMRGIRAAVGDMSMARHDERWLALADAVTRLGEAHDLYIGLFQSNYDSYAECVWAEDDLRASLRAVLAARAALDAGEGEG